jgi:two-component system chemotaxis response regulator CheY
MNTGQITILIANRSPATCAAMQKALTTRGYPSVLTAESGQELLAVLNSRDISLVIIDANLGDASGVDMARALKESGRFPDMLFILTISQSDEKSITQALELGVSALLLKPFTAELFIDTAVQALKEKHGDKGGAPSACTIPPPQHPAGAADRACEAPVDAALKEMFAPLSVLVVDDSSSMRHVLAEFLEKLGFGTVATAKDGQAAWEAVQADENIDLIISDWKMPGLSGIELLDKVRTASHSPALPFIMVTSEAKTENILLAGKHSATAYLVKPFSFAELTTTIRKIFQDRA